MLLAVSTISASKILGCVQMLSMSNKNRTSLVYNVPKYLPRQMPILTSGYLNDCHQLPSQ